MNGIERMTLALARKPADRIPVFEHFWDDTYREWLARGEIQPGDRLEALFDFDMMEFWPFNFTADLDYANEIVEETEDTVLRRNGNYALLRWHKKHQTTPEHVGFLVTDREKWLDTVKPLLQPDLRRVDFEGYRAAKACAAAEGRYFVWSGIAPFECIHPVCGHENMLIGMCEDPEWVKDMAETYTDLTIALQETLFEREGWPDGIWYYEDMGFKGHPFMSPRMYAELIEPSHRRLFSFAHSHGCKVIVHSCGFVDPLVPGLIEAGMDMLEVIEVKAGMDLVSLYRRYGDRIGFMGGMDVRTLYGNDLTAVDRELEAKIPVLLPGCGYALHSDHSIPYNVTRATYEHFIGYGRELGTYPVRR